MMTLTLDIQNLLMCSSVEGAGQVGGVRSTVWPTLVMSIHDPLAESPSCQQSMVKKVLLGW